MQNGALRFFLFRVDGFELFSDTSVPIVAGCVRCAQHLIFVRDAWSGHVALPGGRQEVGESELQAAVRECEEEVGIELVSRQG